MSTELHAPAGLAKTPSPTAKKVVKHRTAALTALLVTPSQSRPLPPDAAMQRPMPTMPRVTSGAPHDPALAQQGAVACIPMVQAAAKTVAEHFQHTAHANDAPQVPHTVATLQARSPTMTAASPTPQAAVHAATHNAPPTINPCPNYGATEQPAAEPRDLHSSLETSAVHPHRQVGIAKPSAPGATLHMTAGACMLDTQVRKIGSASAAAAACTPATEKTQQCLDREKLTVKPGQLPAADDGEPLPAAECDTAAAVVGGLVALSDDVGLRVQAGHEVGAGEVHAATTSCATAAGAAAEEETCMEALCIDTPGQAPIPAHVLEKVQGIMARHKYAILRVLPGGQAQLLAELAKGKQFVYFSTEVEQMIVVEKAPCDSD